MKNMVLRNVLLNLVIATIFIFLNNRAVKLGLEETFISLAMGYGIMVVASNALFIHFIQKNR